MNGGVRTQHYLQRDGHAAVGNADSTRSVNRRDPAGSRLVHSAQAWRVLRQTPARQQARAERQAALICPPAAAAAVPVPAPASKVTSTEWIGTGASTSTGTFSCCISTHTTAAAWSTTAKINAATTVHLLGGLYTAADGATRRRWGRFRASGRNIRITRASGATSEVFNVVVCI